MGEKFIPPDARKENIKPGDLKPIDVIDLLNKKYEIEHHFYYKDRNRADKPEPNERGYLNTGPLRPRDCLCDSDYYPDGIGYRNYPTDLLWERKYSDTAGSEDVAVETSKAVIEAAKKRVDEIIKQAGKETYNRVAGVYSSVDNIQNWKKQSYIPLAMSEGKAKKYYKPDGGSPIFHDELISIREYVPDFDAETYLLNNQIIATREELFDDELDSDDPVVKKYYYVMGRKVRKEDFEQFVSLVDQKLKKSYVDRGVKSPEERRTEANKRKFYQAHPDWK